MNVNTISLSDKYVDKVQMLNELAGGWDPKPRFAEISEKFGPQSDFSLRDIDEKVKMGHHLTMDETFHGMCYVVAGTNSKIAPIIFSDVPYNKERREEYLVKGTYFLTLMAIKETTVGLTGEEVAGLVAAGMMDVVVSPIVASVIETSGMGGDRGWGSRDVKTINASTLSAIVTASCGYKTFKHGSYGNTTKVGSTDVPEMFGAKTSINPQRIQELIEKTNFWFSDAHAVKTLHYLSHRLMVETINHVIGPMTPPVDIHDQLFKLMGVNHNVHPIVITDAYSILNEMGIVNVGAAVVIAGVDTEPNSEEILDQEWYREHCFLDELSPVSTIVSVLYGDRSEVMSITPYSAFGIKFSGEDIKVKNDIKSLLQADKDALCGNGSLSEYLAANSALALWPRKIVEKRGIDLSDLGRCFDEAMGSIINGRAINTLNDYICLSGGEKIYT